MIGFLVDQRELKVLLAAKKKKNQNGGTNKGKGRRELNTSFLLGYRDVRSESSFVFFSLFFCQMLHLPVKEKSTLIG